MVHIVFDTGSVSLNDFAQYGGGGGEITYFKGASPYQRGAGFGDVLRGLWRVLLPVLKSVGKTAGIEALSTGSRILDKVSQGDNLKETLINEGKAGADNLLEKGGFRRQFGSGGIKRRKIQKSIHFKQLKSIRAPLIVGKKVVASKKRNRSDAFGLY